MSSTSALDSLESNTKSCREVQVAVADVAKPWFVENIYLYVYIYMDGPLAKVVVDIPTVHGSAEVNGWADH